MDEPKNTLYQRVTIVRSRARDLANDAQQILDRLRGHVPAPAQTADAPQKPLALNDLLDEIDSSLGSVAGVQESLRELIGEPVAA